MEMVYHLVRIVAENGPAVAPVVLAACWYGFATRVVAEDDVSCRPVYARRRFRR